MEQRTAESGGDMQPIPGPSTTTSFTAAVQETQQPSGGNSKQVDVAQRDAAAGRNTRLKKGKPSK